MIIRKLQIENDFGECKFTAEAQRLRRERKREFIPSLSFLLVPASQRSETPDSNVVSVSIAIPGIIRRPFTNVMDFLIISKLPPVLLGGGGNTRGSEKKLVNEHIR